MEMKTPPIVTAEEWQAARERLLVKEKELTRARDAPAAQRRRYAVAGGGDGLRVRGRSTSRGFMLG